MSSKISLTRRLGLLLVIAALTTAIISACGESTTEPIAKLEGDLNDSTFVATSAFLVDAAFELEATDWFDALFDSLPGSAASPFRSSADRELRRSLIEESIISYDLQIDEVNWWFIFTVTAARGSDTAELIDSVRFMQDGVAINPMVVEGYNQLDGRVHAHVTSATEGVFVGTIASHASILQTLIAEDSIGGDTISMSFSGADTIDGTSWDQLMTCDITATTSKSGSDVMFLDLPTGGESCPFSGSINASATLDMMCVATDLYVSIGGNDTLNINGSWTVSATYQSDGSADVVFEDATTRWSTNVPCESQPQAGPAGNVRFPGRN